MQDRILVRTGMQYELRLNLVGEPLVLERSAIARSCNLPLSHQVLHMVWLHLSITLRKSVSHLVRLPDPIRGQSLLAFDVQFYVLILTALVLDLTGISGHRIFLSTLSARTCRWLLTVFESTTIETGSMIARTFKPTSKTFCRYFFKPLIPR